MCVEYIIIFQTLIKRIRRIIKGASPQLIIRTIEEHT